MCSARRFDGKRTWRPGMASGGLRGIMAIRPWTLCSVRHHRPNGRIAITVPPAPARHPDGVRTSDVACGDAVLRIRALLSLSRVRSRRAVSMALSPSLPADSISEQQPLLGERRRRSRAQAASRAAAGWTPRGLEPNVCGRLVRHRSAAHIGSAEGPPRSLLPGAARSVSRSRRWFDRAPDQLELTPRRSVLAADGARVSNRSEGGPKAVAGIAGGRSAGAAIGNIAIRLTMPNAATKQWQYCS